MTDTERIKALEAQLEQTDRDKQNALAELEATRQTLAVVVEQRDKARAELTACQTELAKALLALDRAEHRASYLETGLAEAKETIKDLRSELDWRVDHEPVCYSYDE